MAKIEEQSACSGVCVDKVEQPGSLYLYSNVNDGTPMHSCKAALRDYVMTCINNFAELLFIVTLLTCFVQGIMLLILFWRIYKFCCRRKQRKNEKSERMKHIQVSDTEECEDQGSDKELNRGPQVVERVEMKEIENVAHNQA